VKQFSRILKPIMQNFFPTCWWVLLLFLCCGHSATAQPTAVIPIETIRQVTPALEVLTTTPAPPADSALRLEELQSRLNEIQVDGEIRESVKNRLVDNYKTAISALERLRSLTEQQAAYQEALQKVPEQIEAIRKRLAETPPPAKAGEINAQAEPLSREQVEQILRREEAALVSARADLQQLENTLSEQAERPTQIRKLIQEARERLIQIERELDASVPTEEAPALSESRLLALQARRKMRRQEIQTLEQELISYDTRQSLLRASRDQAARLVNQVEEQIQAWQSVAQRRRQQQARQSREEAEQLLKQIEGLPPRIKSTADVLAATNIALAQKVESLALKEKKLDEKIQQAGRMLNRLGEDYQRARQRVDKIGFTESNGLLLQREKRQLPGLRKYRQAAQDRREEITEVYLSQLETEQLRDRLSRLEEQVQSFPEQIRRELDSQEFEQLQGVLDNLVEKQRENIRLLLDGYTRYLRKLGELDDLEKLMVDQAEEYSKFIDQHLLWIQSIPPSGLSNLENFRKGMQWLFSPRQWLGLGADAWRSVTREPEIWIPGLAGLILLVYLRQKLRHRLSESSSRAYSFAVTLERLLFTLVVAGVWPLFFLFIGWRLERLIDAGDFTRAFGRAFMFGAWLAWTVDIFRLLCENRGVGQTDFRWPETIRKEIYTHLRWLRWILLVSLSLVTAIEMTDQDLLRRSIGRLSWAVGMVAVTVFMFRLFRLRGSVMQSMAERNPEGWLYRTRFLWYPVVAGFPLFLLLLVVLGYYYTALELGYRFLLSVWFLLVLVLAEALLLRWLRLVQMNIMLAKARQEAEAEEQKEPEEQEQKTEGEQVRKIAQEQDQIHLAQINERTRTLIRTGVLLVTLAGLWMIWSEVLPALRFLNEIKLWTYAVQVGEETQQIPVTLASILLAGLLLLATIGAARDLPHVLELLVLSRLHVDRGSRYAVANLARYTITIIGIILILNVLGVRWGQVQWLIAALGVGLGFGLQEVVANFASGLILLFERPIRIGDTVTIGDITGTVTRIQIRATTITDWDRKELIVPNKEFISGQLINWSLSDPIIRAVIPIGIAYGSDTGLAEKLMLEVAAKNENVLKEPSPKAYFLGFGDNSLNFYLYIYIRGVEERLKIQHQIYRAVDDAFRQAGITIAFPQRDTHLDTLRPLDIRIVKEEGEKREEERREDPEKK
jgi:potassium-dependent mechanosensitive channel